MNNVMIQTIRVATALKSNVFGAKASQASAYTSTMANAVGCAAGLAKRGGPMRPFAGFCVALHPKPCPS